MNSHNLLLSSPRLIEALFCLSGLQSHLSGCCLGSLLNVLFEYHFHDEWEAAAFSSVG